MPQYGLFLVGQSGRDSKFFGWTSDALAGQVYFVGGPYKMVSLFMRVLFTSKGDIIGRPNEGTEFLDLFEGNFADASELQERLTEILDDAFRQTQEIQQLAANTTDVPENELLVDYNITDFFVSSDGTQAAIAVELSNAAGETVPSLIPATGGNP